MKNYQIMNFDEVHGVITVLYENGIQINLDLPIINGIFPDGEKFEQIIQDNYPVAFEQRKAQIDAMPNFEKNKMRDRVRKIPDDEPNPKKPNEPTAAELRKQRALVEEKEREMLEAIRGVVVAELEKRGL